jgi:hypothetical protein
MFWEMLLPVIVAVEDQTLIPPLYQEAVFCEMLLPVIVAVE